MRILDAIYMQLPAIPRRPKSHNGYLPFPLLVDQPHNRFP
jgi:hypothetical protein